LGEGRDGAAQNTGKIGSEVIRDPTNGDEGAFVEVDVEASCLGEEVEDLLEAADLGALGSQDQQGVICILDNGAREVVHERMQQGLFGAFHGNEAREQVGDSKVQVWGQRVSLAQAVLA
jgi:hypothetical protein